MPIKALQAAPEYIYFRWWWSSSLYCFWITINQNKYIEYRLYFISSSKWKKQWVFFLFRIVFGTKNKFSCNLQWLLSACMKLANNRRRNFTSFSAISFQIHANYIRIGIDFCVLYSNAYICAFAFFRESIEYLFKTTINGNLFVHFAYQYTQFSIDYHKNCVLLNTQMCSNGSGIEWLLSWDGKSGMFLLLSPCMRIKRDFLELA